MMANANGSVHLGSANKVCYVFICVIWYLFNYVYNCLCKV